MFRRWAGLLVGGSKDVSDNVELGPEIAVASCALISRQKPTSIPARGDDFDTALIPHGESY